MMDLSADCRQVLKGSGRAANNEAKSVFTLLTKGKTRKGFTKAQSYVQGVQWALCPEGERALVCVFYECQTAGELGTYEPLAETR